MVVQPLRSRRVAVFGAFAQGEERFVAAGGPSGPGDGEHLVEGEVGRLEAGRCFGEGAVAAPVAAQHGEGDEHFGREGHPGAERGVADCGRRAHEFGQRRTQQVGLGDAALRTRLVGSEVGVHRRHLTGSGGGSTS